MRHLPLRIIVVSFILLLLSQLAFAQAAFAAKDYAGYLSKLDVELTPAHAGAPLAFDKLAMVVVALEKTQGWAKASGAQARGLLEKDAEASARLGALHALLAGEVKPVVALYAAQGKEPAVAEGRAAIVLLRAQGYPLAANVLATLARELNEARIIAWASIPAAQRAPIDAYMLAHYLPKGQNRCALVKLALQLFLKPSSSAKATADQPPFATVAADKPAYPKTTADKPAFSTATVDKPIDPKIFFELAMLFGKDTGLLDMQLAQRLVYGGKMAEGRALLLSLIPQRDTDFILVQQAAFLLGTRGDAEGAEQVYRLALTSVREPYTREVRLDYLEFLQRFVYDPDAQSRPAASAIARRGEGDWVKSDGSDRSDKSERSGGSDGVGPDKSNSKLSPINPAALPSSQTHGAPGVSVNPFLSINPATLPSSRAKGEVVHRYRSLADAAATIPPAPGGSAGLLAGDICLCEKHYTEAGAKYTARLQDATAPLPARLAAWGGLLDSDPAAGLAAADAVCALLAPLPPATRAPLLRWCGWQVDRLAERELPPDPHSFTFPTRLSFRPVHDVAAWETTLATAFDRLLALDTPGLLMPDPERYGASLRPTAALLYTLARRGEPAYQALTAPIGYDVPPPPGGWTIFDGSPDQHADQPCHYNSPYPGESLRTLSALDEACARYQWQKMGEKAGGGMGVVKSDGSDKSDKSEGSGGSDGGALGVGLPLSAAVIRHRCAELAGEQDARVITAKVREIAAALKMTAMALDPTPAVQHLDQPAPPARAVDLAQFTPLADAIRAALRNDAVARQAIPLLQDGELAALQIAGAPPFTDALFALLTDTLHRYAAVTPEVNNVRYERHHLAVALAGRPIYHMKPYADRLQAEQ